MCHTTCHRVILRERAYTCDVGRKNLIRWRNKMWWHRRKSETGEFLALLLRSGLLDEIGIREASRGVDAQSGGESDLNKMCSHLVANGSITLWQCDKLRSGRHKGFFLDNYKLIDHVCKDDISSTYLAVSVDSVQRVGLRLTFPGGRGKSIKYDVVDLEAD
jgi:hypothetical protein